MVQRPARADEIEGAGLERKACRIAFDERDIRRRARASPLEQLGDDVDADDLANERCEREGQRPGAGPDVEGSLVAVRGDERLQLLAHHLHLLLGVLRHARRRRAEARANLVGVRAVRRMWRLRHRSPSVVPAAAQSRHRT